MLLASCRHRVPGPADVSLYLQGLDAFRNATPEGYERAIETFRKATALNPSRCEYRFHLAQSLLFLAVEQQLNWEEFSPRVAEATAIADTEESTSNSAFSPFLSRLRALAASPRFRTGSNTEALAAIDRALDRDPGDGMNWMVLSQLNPADPRGPALRAVGLSPDLTLVPEPLALLERR
jgi:tetratricopeptide (TPR) repeat protein